MGDLHHYGAFDNIFPQANSVEQYQAHRYDPLWTAGLILCI